MTDHRDSIESNLQAFTSKSLRQASLDLLATLGYQSDKTIDLEDSKPQTFLNFIKEHNPAATFNEEKALVADWKSADLLFQLTDDEISGQTSLFKDVRPGLLRSYLFFAIELTGDDYARGKLTAIARQINRVFPMPVMVLIKHHADKQPVLSIAVINRRQSKRDIHKDVLEKTTIIRDISLTEPHRGHLDILNDLVFVNLSRPEKKPITDFDALHTAWEQIFNVELLNNRFYKELSNWYLWALPKVEFPADLEPDDEKRCATSLIRLLTRLVFCWFLKEKGLIPDKLFHTTELAQILKGFDSKSEDDSNYYQAILQNLFFATLNQRMGNDDKGKPHRKFARDEGFQKNRTTHDVNNLFRYEKHFAIPEEKALALFADIPFLNGGLFECLDRRDEDAGKTRYLDGFSRNAKKRPQVPNHLFFSDKTTTDLSEAYGDKKRKRESVSGLLRILNGYKFTIVENTPIDQEIALDPELLGKVFENLLASYNEETKTTARKQTGSFYTPRPIVDYMVDESLKAHFTRVLVEKTDMQEGDAEAGLDILFTYTEQEHAFTPAQVAVLIPAIYSCKILDPACGSGAFPMGVLHKLVYILGKLDPGNEHWKQTQLDKLDSAPMREELERIFADNDDDYGRKFHLIQNCLYGVDIQPIAIQISKLRFFISLVCDQQINREKDNLGIRPLPNLETKFVAANSLIGLDRVATKQQYDIHNPDIEEKERKLNQVRTRYFNAKTLQDKRKCQEQDEELREEIAELLIRDGWGNSDAQKIARWKPYDQNASAAAWFDPERMFGVNEGFDMVIGNPPYVRADTQSESNIAQRQAILASKQYETLWEKWDLFVPFLERSYKLLRSNGVSTMIVSDAFCHSKYAQKAQNWFLQNARILRLDFCGKVKIFDAAVHNVITCFQKAEGTKWKPERRLHREAFGEVTKLPSDEQAKLTYRAFFPEESTIVEYLVQTVPIEAICYISVGMVVNAHENLAQGAFKLDDLLADRCDATHPKRFVEGKNADRWYRRNCSWIEWGTDRAPRLFRRQTFKELYEQPEKLLLVKVGAVRVAYDSESVYTNEGIYVGVPWHQLNGVRNKSLKKSARYQGENPPRPDLPKREELEATSRRFAVKYLLGIMNSSSAREFLRTNRRNNVQLYPNDWKKLPIPDVSAARQQPIVGLVDQILTLKRANPAADINALETQLDAAVATLYGLTPEEIAIVESTAK